MKPLTINGWSRRRSDKRQRVVSATVSAQAQRATSGSVRPLVLLNQSPARATLDTDGIPAANGALLASSVGAPRLIALCLSVGAGDVSGS